MSAVIGDATWVVILAGLIGVVACVIFSPFERRAAPQLSLVERVEEATEAIKWAGGDRAIAAERLGVRRNTMDNWFARAARQAS